MTAIRRFWHRRAKPQARPGDMGVIGKAAQRVKITMAAVLGGLAVLLWQHGADNLAEAVPMVKKTTHIAIPSALFDVAESVCRSNGGYRSVTVERKSDTFTFTCQDGLSLRDTLVRVK